MIPSYYKPHKTPNFLSKLKRKNWNELQYNNYSCIVLSMQCKINEKKNKTDYKGRTGQQDITGTDSKHGRV